MDWVCDHWEQCDEGIWETRGGRKNFVFSRLMRWVAIERAMRMACRRGLPANLEHWRRARDAIYHQIMRRGWSPTRQAFVQHEDDDVLDAAVLMMPMAKFVSPTDPQWLATLDALTAELVSDSLVYRYDPQASPDGLRGEEGSACTAFHACWHRPEGAFLPEIHLSSSRAKQVSRSRFSRICHGRGLPIACADRNSTVSTMLSSMFVPVNTPTAAGTVSG